MKKKVLSFLTVAILAFCGWWLYLIYTNKEVINTTPNASITPIRVEPPKPVTPADFPITELVAETNEERTRLGLAALTESPKLDASALAKCNDMVAKNYWSHYSPDGAAPWHFLSEANYSYRTAGENLAHGQNSPSKVTSDWMGSPKHKENIVNPSFREIGFGICLAPAGYANIADQSRIIVVQHLARPY